MNYLDVTRKFKIEEIDLYRNKVESLQLPYLGIDHQVDTYFQTDKGKLKWRDGQIERIITHYERIPAKDGELTQVYRYEVNPSQEAVTALFESHSVIGITRKKRHIFKSEEIKIHLDEL